MENWSDARAGQAALGVIVGFGLLLLLILAFVYAYATTLGYGFYLP